LLNLSQTGQLVLVWIKPKEFERKLCFQLAPITFRKGGNESAINRIAYEKGINSPKKCEKGDYSPQKERLPWKGFFFDTKTVGEIPTVPFLFHHL